MILGALYLVLAVATSLLWVRTNVYHDRPNYWRLYLAVASVAGALYTFLPFVQALAVAFVFTAVAAGLYVYKARKVQALDRLEARNILLCSAGIFVLAAINSLSLIGLLIVVVGVFFTYVPLGQRWYDELPSNLGLPPRRRY